MNNSYVLGGLPVVPNRQDEARRVKEVYETRVWVTRRSELV